MEQNNNHRTSTLDYMVLPVIMILAFYLAFIPHYNYPYPVHVDEWWHMAFSEGIIRAGSTTFIDPFSGGPTVSLTSNLETGFQVLWGVFHQISGISWLIIFRYFPAIIFMFTVLSVYVLARREGFGLEAAFFACLIPTTVGILGPGFLVPVATALLFMPLSIFVLYNFKTVWSYVSAFLFVCFLLLDHSPTAIGLVVLLAPYILLNLIGDFKHSLGVALAIGFPFLASLPWIFPTILTMGKGLLVPQLPAQYVELPRVIESYGYLPTAFSLLGTFVLAIKGGRKSYGLVLGLLAIMLLQVTFFTFHYGISVLYERALMYMMLAIAIVAGAGLMVIRKISLPGLGARLKATFIGQHLGNILCLVLVGVTLTIAIPVRQNTPYYHMIDNEDYQVFVWVKENVDASYQRAVLDPWKASAFSAITGKYVYARLHFFPHPEDTKANDFLKGDCADTNFMKTNGISLVYTRGKCDNPDLTEVRQFVYLLKPK